jgi:predicted RNase H-like HicB family nuclease
MLRCVAPSTSGRRRAAGFGRIPGIEGLWADGTTVEACREALASALEDWVVFGLVNGYPVPPIDGTDLASARVA